MPPHPPPTCMCRDAVAGLHNSYIDKATLSQNKQESTHQGYWTDYLYRRPHACDPRQQETLTAGFTPHPPHTCVPVMFLLLQLQMELPLIPFASTRHFLQSYPPRHLWKLSTYSSSRTTDVKSVQPSQIKHWAKFDAECGALLGALPGGGPFHVWAPPLFRTVDSEEELQRQLDLMLLMPLQQACARVYLFFAYCGRRSNVQGLCQSGAPSLVSATCARTCKPGLHGHVRQCSHLPRTWAQSTTDSSFGVTTGPMGQVCR